MSSSPEGKKVLFGNIESGPSAGGRWALLTETTTLEILDRESILIIIDSEDLRPSYCPGWKIYLQYPLRL